VEPASLVADACDGPPFASVRHRDWPWSAGSGCQPAGGPEAGSIFAINRMRRRSR
jgi:hypothetical protein